MTMLRIPDVHPVHDSDGDIDSQWVMVRSEELTQLEHEHRLLLDVAKTAERGDAIGLRNALYELPIDLALITREPVK